MFAKLKYYCHRYFVEGMSAMALGLFASLIINLIISQIAQIPGLDILNNIAEVFGASSPVVGAAIGVAVSWGLKGKPLVMFSCAAAGACGYYFGGPVGAFVGATIGNEIGMLVSGKTPVDIVVTPLVTIISGGLVAYLVGPPISGFMTFLGSVINDATMLSPFPMGIAVAVLVGMALTAPISSAALCIMLDLSGLAAGAACAGCCAQMIGFAVAGIRDNGKGSFFAVGLGTSMLQFSNIMRHPQIWLAPTIASAIVGPISTCIFQMTNTATGAGMGTSGLVGQFGAFSVMAENVGAGYALLDIALVHFIIPAVLVLLLDFIFRRSRIIHKGDMLLPKI